MVCVYTCAFLWVFGFGRVYVCHCSLVLKNRNQKNTVKENVDICFIYHWWIFCICVCMCLIFLVWICHNTSTVRWKLPPHHLGLCWVSVFPWCLRWTDEHVYWKSPADRALELQRLAVLFTHRWQGCCKANIQVKSQRDVKPGLTGSHAFPAKLYKPCTANLTCHEPPSPAFFSLHHQCPALTQPAVSLIMKSL